MRTAKVFAISSRKTLVSRPETFAFSSYFRSLPYFFPRQRTARGGHWKQIRRGRQRFLERRDECSQSFFSRFLYQMLLSVALPCNVLISIFEFRKKSSEKWTRRRYSERKLTFGVGGDGGGGSVVSLFRIVNDVLLGGSLRAVRYDLSNYRLLSNPIFKLVTKHSCLHFAIRECFRKTSSWLSGLLDRNLISVGRGSRPKYSLGLDLLGFLGSIWRRLAVVLTTTQVTPTFRLFKQTIFLLLILYSLNVTSPIQLVIFLSSHLLFPRDFIQFRLGGLPYAYHINDPLF